MGTCKEWTAKVLRERRKNCSPAALILISCRKQNLDHFEFWHLWFWKSWQTCLNQILRSSCPLPVSPLIAWTSTCLGYFDILGEGSTCKTLFGCPPPVILILQRIMTCSQPDLLGHDILFNLRKLFIDFKSFSFRVSIAGKRDWWMMDGVYKSTWDPHFRPSLEVSPPTQFFEAACSKGARSQIWKN